MGLFSATRSSVSDLDGISFTVLLVSIIGVGLVLEGYQWMMAIRSIRLPASLSTWLDRIILVVPIIVGALSYIRKHQEARMWEISFVVLWGAIMLFVSYAFLMVAGPVIVIGPQLSSFLASGTAEIVLSELLRYLGTTSVFAVFYAIAASQRNRPFITVFVLLTLPAGIIGIYALM